MKKNISIADGQLLITSRNSFPVIGVGASAGGLEAFTKLIGAIPAISGMAYVLVQHLPPRHETMLAEILQKATPIRVIEIVDDLKILPDHIYIIPGNKVIIVQDGMLALGPRTAKHKELNLPIDIFFSSLAEVFQSHAIGIVLSGTASDGTRGLKAIKEHGGITFAQDAASAAFDGMPHSAVLAGVVDFILPPEQIPAKILELTQITGWDGGEDDKVETQDAEVFRQILGLLRTRKGTDFTYYKQTTIRRRILRKMAMNKQREPAAYLKFLLGNMAEQDALYQDLLIPVTSFFRDHEIFDHVCETVFPRILNNNPGDDVVRLWVAGCSTGEEAYSLAICIKEYLKTFLLQERPAKKQDGHASEIKVQIFASDLSEPAIAKARAGLYKTGDTDGLSAKRLQEFFTKKTGGYLVNKEIRDMCVFAVHDFLKEPPFGKMNFISCRNVLIYMEPYLQKKALATFHYSLKPGGIMLLGKSENIAIVPELFATGSAQDKIFLRKDGPDKFMHVVTKNTEQKLQESNDSLRTEPAHNFAGDKHPGSSKKEAVKPNDDIKDLRIKNLERELAQNLEDLLSITEDQEAGNAEMKTANKELVNSSEELQILNEELETSKEELQSANEELMVVNQELISMNELISIARDYSQNIISTIREPFVVLDKDMRVKTANAAFYKTFQVIEKDTEGVLIYNLGNGQWDIPLLRNLLENILPQNSMFADYELKISFPDIGERTMVLNAREIKSMEGGERLMLLTIADITEHKKAEKIIADNEQQFAFIAESMPQKVWTADADGKRNYFNRQWVDYTGMSLEELKNDGWKKIIHPDDLVATDKLWRYSLATGNDFEVEDRKRNKEGQYKWHLSRAIAFKDDAGKITMWVGTNTEMEKQKNYSVELEKAVADRTFELKNANRQLEEKNNELLAMNKELESFTYVSSHDLQEPLRKIQTFAGRIMEKENQNLSEYGKDMFRRMQDAGQRMQTLIQDLLAFSRLSTTERKFETTRLIAIVEEVKREFKEIIEEKNANIEAGELGELKIITFQFRQLVHNLISNALKFSKTDTPPHISIQARIAKGIDLDNPNLSKHTTYCHITVADNGIGFEPEFNDKIFDVFQKLHGKDEYAGTGIGLAIVKKIVENHKGIITATSELGKGAKFDIYIPVS